MDSQSSFCYTRPGNRVGVGAFVFVWGLGWPVATVAPFFDLMVFVYPIERLLGSIIVAVILLALGEALSRTDFRPPLTNLDSAELAELKEDEI